MGVYVWWEGPTSSTHRRFGLILRRRVLLLVVEELKVGQTRRGGRRDRVDEREGGGATRETKRV